MRLPLLLPALLSLALVVSAAPQAPATPNTPDTLTAAYNQAMQLRDSTAMEAAIETYNRAIAAAQQEKPAQGQLDTAWKANLAKIFLARAMRC